MNRRGFIAGLVAAVVAGPASLLQTAKWKTPPVSMVFIAGKWRNVSDIYISTEALDDIRAWGVDELDEQTKKEIFTYGWK